MAGGMGLAGTLAGTAAHYVQLVAGGFVVGTISGFGAGLAADRVVVPFAPPPVGTAMTPGVAIGMGLGGVAGVGTALAFGHWTYAAAGGAATGLVGGTLPLVAALSP